MENVLITGSRAPIALDLARSFSKFGHKVVMADSLKFTVARWSNSVSAYYVLPSPRFKTLEFVSKIKEIIEKENITHIIPTCEETFYISIYKSEFNCKVWVSEISILNNLHNKFLFSQFAKDYFQIPETLILKEFTDWENSKQYVFKSSYSRFCTSTIINEKIFSTKFTEIEKESVIAQKFIKGKEICVYSIWNKGVMKAYTAYHSEIRAGKGAGIYFEFIENLEVKNLVQHFGKNIEFTGQLSFDVIINEENVPFFIECNPRGTSGAHLINNNLADVFFNDIIIEINNQKTFSIKYAIALYKFGSLFKYKIRKSKDVIFSWSDLLPFVLQTLSLYEISFIKFKNRISLIEATTHDIEWNG